MTDLLAEVDDMMRRERLEDFWHRHRLKIIAAIAAIILGTGLYSAWTAWAAHTRTRNTDALIALTQDPEFPQNMDAAGSDVKGNPRGLTWLLAAGTHMRNNETEAALALYEKIDADRSLNGEIRQLGTLMKVRLLAEQDNPDLEKLGRDLESVYQDKPSPWQNAARLDAAALAAEQKQFAKAREILKPALEDETQPETFLAKLRALDHLYDVRAAAQKTGNDS